MRNVCELICALAFGAAILLASCAFATFDVARAAELESPNCSDYIHKGANSLVYVKNDRAEVRRDPSQEGGGEPLSFGKSLYASDRNSEGWVKVYAIGAFDSIAKKYRRPEIGWIHEDNLLCSANPLQVTSRRSSSRDVTNAPARIPEAFFIDASRKLMDASGKDVAGANPASRLIPRQPDGTCEDRGRCTPLYRLVRYYVYDEKSAASGEPWLLVGNQPNLDIDRQNLIGWVPKSWGYLWTTTYAARGGKDPNTYVCAFSDPSIAEQNETSWKPRKKTFRSVKTSDHVNEAATDAPDGCIQIPGGDEVWMKTKSRLWIMEGLVPSKATLSDLIRHVPAVSNEESNVRKRQLVKVIVPYISVKTSREPASTYSFEAQNRGVGRVRVSAVDVVFAIDATNSMQRHIDDVARTLVPAITDKLRNSERFRGARFRFGWVIYRDRTIAPWPGEQLEQSLPQECDSDGLQTFQRTLRGIRVSTEQNEPVGHVYPEDTFDGVYRGIRELTASCPDHNKVLVVIGDAGYADYGPGDRIAQIEKTVALLHPTGARAGIVPIYIRIPKDPLIQRNRREYEQAWEGFKADGEQVLALYSDRVAASFERIPDSNLRTAVLDRFGSSQVGQTVLDAESSTLSKSIENVIALYVDATTEPELAIRVAAGASFFQALTEVVRTHEDMPIFRVEWLLGENCSQNFKICGQGADERTTTAYLWVGGDADVRIDVGVQQRDLENLIAELDKLVADSDRSPSPSETREVFANGLADLVNFLMGYAPTRRGPRESLESIIRRHHAFPIAHGSPLLQYSGPDIRSSSRVSDDELEQLYHWIRRSRALLGLIPARTPLEPESKPLFRWKQFGKRYLPVVTVPENVSTSVSIKSRPLPSGMSWCHDIDNTILCWVPNQWLP